MKKLLVAMLLGAGLSYLFDPDNGARRRITWQRRLNRGQTPAGVAAPITTAPGTAAR